MRDQHHLFPPPPYLFRAITFPTLLLHFDCNAFTCSSTCPARPHRSEPPRISNTSQVLDLSLFVRSSSSSSLSVLPPDPCRFFIPTSDDSAAVALPVPILRLSVSTCVHIPQRMLNTLLGSPISHCSANPSVPNALASLVLMCQLHSLPVLHLPVHPRGTFGPIPAPPPCPSPLALSPLQFPSHESHQSRSSASAAIHIGGESPFKHFLLPPWLRPTSMVHALLQYLQADRDRCHRCPVIHRVPAHPPFPHFQRLLPK